MSDFPHEVERKPVEPASASSELVVPGFVVADCLRNPHEAVDTVAVAVDSVDNVVHIVVAEIVVRIVVAETVVRIVVADTVVVRIVVAVHMMVSP